MQAWKVTNYFCFTEFCVRRKGSYLFILILAPGIRDRGPYLLLYSRLALIISDTPLAFNGYINVRLLNRYESPV